MDKGPCVHPPNSSQIEVRPFERGAAGHKAFYVRYNVQTERLEKNKNVLTKKGHSSAKRKKEQRESLLKVFGSHEFLFYMDTRTHCPELLPYIPIFLGVGRSSTCDGRMLELLDEAEVRRVLSSHFKERPFKDPSLFIILEDGTREMDFPCVLDLKLGRPDNGQLMSAERIAYMREKANSTTTASHAIKIDGGIWWRYNVNTGDGRKQPRHGTRTLTENKISKPQGRLMSYSNMSKAVEDFLRSPCGRLDLDLVLYIRKEILAIYNTLKEHTFYSFYSTSLLIIYDALNHNKVYIKLIDFAHVVRNELIQRNRDNNITEGLKNLVCVFEKIVLDAEPTPAKTIDTQKTKWEDSLTGAQKSKNTCELYSRNNKTLPSGGTFAQAVSNGEPFPELGDPGTRHPRGEDRHFPDLSPASTGLERTGCGGGGGA